MTRYCPECDREVMPTKVGRGAFRCPEHGWMGEVPRSRDVEWTPERMQQEIYRLQATAMQYFNR